VMLPLVRLRVEWSGFEKVRWHSHLTFTKSTSRRAHLHMHTRSSSTMLFHFIHVSFYHLITSILQINNTALDKRTSACRQHIT
jgi:hypothetical protein